MAIFSQETDLINRDGTEAKVSTTTFAGSYGVKLAARVGLIILPMMIPTMSSEDKKSLLKQNVDFSKIAKTLTTTMSEEKVLSTIMEVVKSTIVNGKDLGKKPLFDEVFAGNYKLLFNIIKFVLEVNYGDFFEEGGIFEMTQTMLPTIGEN